MRVEVSAGKFDYVYSADDKADRTQPPMNLHLQGGYLIPPEEAQKWASRVANEDVSDYRLDIAVHLRPFVRQYGARFSLVAHPETSYMVVTQEENHYGYFDDPLPKEFIEGQREEQARRILDEQGMSYTYGPTFAHGVVGVKGCKWATWLA